MKIAVSVVSNNMDDTLRYIDRIDSFVVNNGSKENYMIEIRADCIANPNINKLVTHSNIKKILTVRDPSEGGVNLYSDEKKIEILQEGIDSKVEIVDIEFKKFYLKKALEFPEENTTEVEISSHNMICTPENLDKQYRKMNGMGADIIKYVTTANSYGDSLRMLDFISKTSGKFIGLCMGNKEFSSITRILGPIYGSFVTFAPIEKGKESARGQVTVKELLDTWKTLGVYKK